MADEENIDEDVEGGNEDEPTEDEDSTDEKGLRESFKTEEDWDNYKKRLKEKSGAWKKKHWVATKAGRGVGKAGKAVGRGAGKAGKAVGRGLGKGYGAVKGWLGREHEKTFGWPYVVFVIIVSLMIVFFFSWWYGFVLFAFLLFMKWLHKKYNKVFKWILIIGIILMLGAGYFAMRSTGLYQTFMSKYGVEEGAGGSTRVGVWAVVTRWVHCNIVAPGTCIEAKAVGEKGGVFFEKLRYSPSLPREGSPIEIIGDLRVDTWSADPDKAKGPSPEDVVVTAYAKWKDKDTIDNSLWDCDNVSPEYPNFDFTCFYKEGVHKIMRAKDMCGTNFRALDTGDEETKSGEMSCEVDVTAQYDFYTANYRKLFFSNSPDEVKISSRFDEDKVNFYTAGPVSFTTGSTWHWYEAITPPDGGSRVINVLIDPVIELSTDSGILKIFDVKDQAILKEAVLEITKREGMTIVCCEGCLQEDTGEQVICTKTEFENDVIDIKSGSEEFTITLGFSPFFMGAYGEKDEVTVDITGTLHYNMKTTKTLKVPIKYVVKDDEVWTWEATPENHGCGLDEMCIASLLKKKGGCENAECEQIDTSDYGALVRCYCKPSTGTWSARCCNGLTCNSPISSSDINVLRNVCNSFDATIPSGA